MKYYIVDGYLNGTGIRDKYQGEYIDLCSLNVSCDLVTKINDWLSDYWNECYNQYQDNVIIDNLDKEGIWIANELKKEINNCKIEYYSDAKQMTLLI